MDRTAKPQTTPAMTLSRLMLVLLTVALCSCFGGYNYHIKRSSSAKVPPGSPLAQRIADEQPDWPVPPACRGASLVMRVGETKKVVSELGSPWKTGFLVPGLVCEDTKVARVVYGGGKNDGDVIIVALRPGETRAWYVTAVGSGKERAPRQPDRDAPADLSIRVLP